MKRRSSVSSEIETGDLFFVCEIGVMKLSYVKNLELDEIRNGFIVTSERKRIWNKEIELILEFARVCEKYNLKWFADFGTLLGAARHGGFIPWDDDVDLAMPREDYEKLKSIAPAEFRYPYHFDFWYENDEPAEYDFGWPMTAFAKLRDSRTMFVEYPERTTFPQGVWIDIFPLDGVPPFDDSPNSEEIYRDFKLTQDLFFISCIPDAAREYLQNPSKYQFLLNPEQVMELLHLPFYQRGKIYEEQLINFDRTTRFVSPMGSIPIGVNITQRARERKFFDETIYLPFEEISLPAPKHFEEILQRLYGDWRKFEIQECHAQIYSVDFSFDEYLSIKNSPRTPVNCDEIRNGFIVSTWKKKFRKAQLDLISEFNRICDKLNLKYWAASSTLFAAAKFHGFNPEDDFATLKMNRKDIEKLQFRFPFRFENGRLMDDRTAMIEVVENQNPHQGIFIEIVPTDDRLDELDYLPFESISIPVPKNYDEILKRMFEGYPDIQIARQFPTLVVSADISYEEYFDQAKRPESVQRKSSEE